MPSCDIQIFQEMRKFGPTTSTVTPSPTTVSQSRRLSRTSPLTSLEILASAFIKMFMQDSKSWTEMTNSRKYLGHIDLK